MSFGSFDTRLHTLIEDHQRLLERPNQIDESWYNGVFTRYQHPVLTAAHAPLYWRFDLDRRSNPLLLERIGVNAAMNSGAIEIDGRILLMVRVEGIDRKSFFAVAESPNGIDNFRFWDHPVTMPETGDPDTNVYDMRLVRHADGWIYGIFCTERKDPAAAAGDTSAAVAQAGIARTRDLRSWERLPDLKSRSAQQRNVVLHPEFVDGKYAWYTRPQDGFIATGSGGGIGYALSDSIENAEIGEEVVIEPKVYHTIKESKNGAGGAPIKTEAGWLHIAHGVRGCASGLRYVVYAFMCDLEDPSRVIHRPGGYLIAPRGPELWGDVLNVAFTNGAVAQADGRLLIYYANCDTNMWVAETTVERMVDYCVNTPEDALRSAACVAQRNQLIDRNLKLIAESSDPLLKRCGPDLPTAAAT